MGMLYRFRMWIGDKLFNFGELIEDLSRKAYGWEPTKYTEKEISIMSQSTMAKVFLRKNYPCQTCNGEGAIELPTNDVATCPDCHGTGVDLKKVENEPLA